MKISCLISFALCITPLLTNAQNKTINCSEIHNGTFYFYPQNSSDRYFSLREGNVVKEANINDDSDTTVWEAKWLSECTYSLSYRSGATKATKETIDLLKKHKLVYRIESLTEDYYVFTGHVDKTSNLPFQKDTMWMHEKLNGLNNELFKPVANLSIPRKENFSDTSSYALLYLYRPGKLSNSLGKYLLYFNDNVMCVARNNTGYLFKIFKEGTFNIKSRLFKDESSVDLNVKFGNVYYVKSMINWGITRRLYNFKLEMAQVAADIGKSEFENVNFR